MRPAFLLIACFLYSCNPAYAAPVTPNSFHFQAVPNATVTCSASTDGATATISNTSGASAPDLIVRNIGTVQVYFEIYASSDAKTAAIATSQVINPGEADLLSKYQSDTIGCITASGSASIIATPGTGN